MTNWRTWIENAPRISPLEVALLAAAVLFLYVVPFMLSWNDARRRRRAARQQEMMERWAQTQQLQAAEAHAAELREASMSAETLGLESSPPGEISPAEAAELLLAPTHAAEASYPPQPDTALAAPVTSPAVGLSEPAVGLSDSRSVRRTEPSPLEIQPVEGPARHRFRMQELHRAGLPDWPPAAIRNDPERHRVWDEAERIVEAHWDRLGTVVVASPYPARSTCLGAAEAQNAGRYRVHFLLFPVLWPVGEEQAVAQAILEIDPAVGPIRGWVDALRASELSADHRREILGSGGEA